MQKNWIEFYKKKEAPDGPSSFCLFFLDKKIAGETVADVGCGNGRDTLALAKRYKKVIGIDPNCVEDDEVGSVKFIKKSLMESKKQLKNIDIVYSRFFLHSIQNNEIVDLVKTTNKYFVAEARALGDKPILYPEHKRNYINTDWLLEVLTKNEFEILFFQKSKGLAIYKNEDPLVFRIIAKRK